VFLSGGSLEANAEIAHKLGFLNFHKDQLKSIREVTKFPDREVLILTTGGQGEPMAALSRMAGGAHAQVKIHEGDTVVVSSLPIIGNEKQVAFLIDSLVRRGAKVVNHQIMDVHTSGHGNQEDLKLMLNLMRPRNFAPVHGSYSMRKAHGELARATGVPGEKVFVLDDGDALSVVGGAGGVGSVVTAKKGVLKVGYMVVEGGQNRGALGSLVLKEREIMAENGFVSVLIKVHGGRVVGAPLVSTRGFVYQKDLEKVLREIAVRARTSVEAFVAQEKRKLRESDFEARVRADVSGLIMQKMNRRPLVQINVVFV
jgi:ribonuclease J